METPDAIQRGEKHAYLILALIVLASFLLKMYFLLQLPHILGMDSGYYIWHVADMVNGKPHLDEPPLMFMVAAFFSILAGDVMLGVKIAFALFSALMAIPFYLVVKEISKKDWLAWSAAFLGAFCASNWVIAVGHGKNIAGLFFGLFALYFFIRFLQSFGKRDAFLLASAFFLMLASHFSSSAYFVAALLPTSLSIAAFLFIKKRTEEPAFRACVVFASLSILAAIVILIVKPDLITDTGIGTIGLQGSNGSPDRTFPNLAMFDGYNIFSALAFVGLYSLWKKKDFHMLALFSVWVVASFLLTQPQFVEGSWLVRFAMMAFIPFTILIPLGAAHFGKPALTAALLLLISGYVIFDLVQSNVHGLAMPVSSEEYLGLVAFHQEHPGALASTLDMGLNYWLYGIGFDVAENPPRMEPGRQLFVFINKNPRQPINPPPNFQPVQIIGKYEVYAQPPPSQRQIR